VPLNGSNEGWAILKAKQFKASFLVAISDTTHHLKREPLVPSVDIGDFGVAVFIKPDAFFLGPVSQHVRHEL